MGWEQGEWQQPKGTGRWQGCPGHTPHSTVQEGCSPEPPADPQLSLLSPGKVTSGNLGNSKAGEAGGESFLQYSRDHDRTFISTLMSGGISSPGGRARPTLLLTLFMRFLTFPATKQQTAAHGMLGHGEDTAMKNSHLTTSLVCLNLQSRAKGCTTCSISQRPWLSSGLTYLPLKSTVVMKMASAGTHHDVGTRTVPAPFFAAGEKEIKRGGTGGYEYAVISTDPNSVGALCPALST